MIDSLSGNIGFIEPLESLKDIYGGSTVQQRKVDGFKEEFGAWRSCRGDGNCFYRACGFAILEASVQKGPATFLPPVLETMRLSAAGEAHGFLAFLQSLCKLEPKVALETLYRSFLSDESRDKDLVRVMRLVCAKHLLSNQEKEFNGLPLSAYVEAAHGMSLEDFRQNEVLRNGTEAESVTLMLVPMAFGQPIEIIQLDRSDSNARYMVPEGAPGDDVVATLLFKPGHYDIIYRKALGDELVALQEEQNVRADCTKRRICPICMDNDAGAMLPCGCAFCAECMESYKASGATGCAVCGKSF